MSDTKIRKFTVGAGRSFMLPTVLAGRPRRVESGETVELEAAHCRRGQRVLSTFTRHGDLVESEAAAAPAAPVAPVAPTVPTTAPAAPAKA